MFSEPISLRTFARRMLREIIANYQKQFSFFFLLHVEACALFYTASALANRQCYLRNLQRKQKTYVPSGSIN